MLVFHGVDHAFAGRPVLRAVDLSVADGTKAALVGPNGAGKTTLLRLAAGFLDPHAGEVVRPPAVDVAYVPQDYGAHGRARVSVAEYVKERVGLRAVEAELRLLERRLGDGDAEDLERYGRALDRFEALGGWEADARVLRALSGTGLGAEFAERPLGELSGGEQVRAGLAAILASRFALYLMDEPTNNLDADGLELLERFVRESPATFLIVSHDRVFLERVAEAVVLLDPSEQGVELYGVPYTRFVELRERARAARVARWEAHCAEVERLSSAAAAQSATAGRTRDRRPPRDNDKFAKHFFLARQTEQAARAARRLEQRLARMEPVEEPADGWELRMVLDAGARSGDVVVRAEGACARAGDFALGPVDVEIGWGERVAVVGANGSGKSTLLGLLTGREAPDSGAVRAGSGVRFGVLRQGGADLAGPASGLERFRAATGWREAEARTLMAKFGLGARHVHRAVDSYSPGERCRLGLASLMAAGANCLVLDEPTNHLDLDAVEELERALAGFTGTLLVVSHDRRFLREVGVRRRIRLMAGAIVDDGPVGEGEPG